MAENNVINNPDAAAWIENEKKRYIVENGGNWVTEQERENGIAEAERQAVKAYNEKYGTEVVGNSQGAKITTSTYDANGNVTKRTVRVTNASGDTTTTYDGQGNVVSQSTTTTTTSKDENGKTIYETTTKTTDGSGRVTSTTTTTTNPDGSSKTVETSVNSTVTTEQASDGSKTTTTVRGGAQGAVVETMTRDADGNVTSRTERVSNSLGDTTTTYDGNGRVTSTTTTTTNPDGSKKTVETSGNQTTTTVQASNGTTTKTTVRGSAQGAIVTTETYDEQGNLTSRTVRDSSAHGDTSVSVSQDEDGLKVGYSSDREGKTNSEVEIDFEKFIMAYDKVQSLVDAASHISEYKNISGVNALPVKGGGSIDTSALTSMACMNGACGRGGNISDVSSTMLKVINAIVAFDDDSATLWDKYNQEKNGTAPDDFGGDLSEEADNPPVDTHGPADTDPDPTELATEAQTTPGEDGPGSDVPGPEDVTEATTEVLEEEKMKILAEQLGVDIDDLANGAKYITNGEDFDGLNIYYEEGSTTETSLVNRMLNILNTFGRTADDQSLYDANGNKIERLDPNATELTFKYKKDGKEHTITLKLNNELPLEDKKYPGIQVIVK